MAKPKKTPITVGPSGSEWWVRLGSQSGSVTTFDTKSEAVSFAEFKAESEKRPGVVVKKMGNKTPFRPARPEYQKFIPNDAYWKRGYWEA